MPRSRPARWAGWRDLMQSREIGAGGPWFRTVFIFAKFFGQIFGFFQSGFEPSKPSRSTQTHPSEPIHFTPPFDFGITAGHNDGDILRVFHLDAIFRGGVPDSIGSREIAVAFKFRWARAIEIQPPSERCPDGARTQSSSCPPPVL